MPFIGKKLCLACCSQNCRFKGNIPKHHSSGIRLYISPKECLRPDSWSDTVTKATILVQLNSIFWKVTSLKFCYQTINIENNLSFKLQATLPTTEAIPIATTWHSFGPRKSAKKIKVNRPRITNNHSTQRRYQQMGGWGWERGAAAAEGAGSKIKEHIQKNKNKYDHKETFITMIVALETHDLSSWLWKSEKMLTTMRQQFVAIRPPPKQIYNDVRTVHYPSTDKINISNLSKSLPMSAAVQETTIVHCK